MQKKQREAGKAARTRKAAAREKRGGSHARGVSNKRVQQSAARRDAILAAALKEFSASGFAAARLDDVAKRAGVAKGTIYLHFRDKETLFQELIRSTLSPMIGALEAAPAADVPLHAIAEMLASRFVHEVYGTDRKHVVRLVLAEGRRFPKVAEFYYREVVGRAMTAMRKLVARAVERGEIRSDAIGRFPQLIVAPLLIAIAWEGLFDRFEKLDAEAMLRTHFDLMFKGLERGDA
ncbi:MAG: TetR family transcriptional regulator [Bradyrhizobiaceae bacterium]|nr:TetR family transcriptional regulator [Bradyrhizobiaceae bacterium]